MSRWGTRDGWDIREVGSSEASPTVALLPGALCSAEFYEDVMAEPVLAGAHLVAATVPGWAGTTPPNDLSMEAYARSTSRLVADLGAEVVVGHSYGANIAMEMAALGVFSGPIVLLSPTFSREDEFRAIATLNKIRVPGLRGLAWWVALKGVPGQMKKGFPEARREVLAAEMAKNSSSFASRNVGRYFEYLDRYGDLVPRLCQSGVKAWVVRGSDDEIGLKDEERRGLEACPTVTMVTVEGTHMFLVERPAETAAVIAGVLEGVR